MKSLHKGYVLFIRGTEQNVWKRKTEIGNLVLLSVLLSWFYELFFRYQCFLAENTPEKLLVKKEKTIVNSVDSIESVSYIRNEIC